MINSNLILAFGLSLALTPEAVVFESLSSNSMDAEFVDLDGDGDLDLVVAGEHAPNSVLEATDSGFVRTDFPASTSDSEDIAIADFNGDGHLDLVFAAEDNRQSELFLGAGALKFTGPLTPFPEATSNAVITLDVNLDGYADLLFGNAGQNLLLLGNGSGGFTDGTEERLPARIDVTQDVEAADIDADGDLDLVFANEDDNRVLRNDGSGHFFDIDVACLPLRGGTEETREADFGDVDGDGDLDLFFANVDFREQGSGRNRLLLNDGRGCFTDDSGRWITRPSRKTLDIDWFDVNEDGRLDALLANFEGVEVLINTPEGLVAETGRRLSDLSHVPAVDVEVLSIDGALMLFIANFQGADRLIPLDSGASE
jgi:hypothetical protein